MKIRNILMTGVAGAVVAIPGAAFAQGADRPAAVSTGNDIVVTANKREESLNDVGLTITAVSGEQLQQRRVASLEDVASVAPGLIYTPSTNATPIFTLRGIGFNESSLGVYPAVSVYVDQVPLPFPILAAHSAYDLERIEVLKGPQGTLFGQNSTGGAINYIAAKPTDSWEAGGDISYGRFNSIEGNGFISGPIAENMGMRVAMTGKNSDGWQKAYTRDDENGAESYIAGRLTIDWEPTDNISLSFGANAWQDKSEPQAQQLIATHEQQGGPGAAGGIKAIDAPRLVDPIRNAYHVPPAGCASAQICYPFANSGNAGGKFNARDAEWGTQLVDPNTSPANAGGASDASLASRTSFEPDADRDFFQLSMRADIELGSLTLTSLTSYAEFDQNLTVDGDGMELAGFDIQGTGAIETFNQELRLSNDPTSRFRWLVGGNYEDSHTNENQVLRYFANSNYYAANLYINHSGVIIDQEIENYAFFGNLEFDVTDRITLKGAARYTNSTIDAVNQSYTGVNGNVDKLFNVLGGLSGQAFTPIGPNQSYTLNNIALANVPGGAIPGDVTVTSPTSSGPGIDTDGDGIPDLGVGLGVPGVDFAATLKQDNISWRGGIDFKATDDILLYANVSRGYKAGSFPALAAAQFTSALPVTQEKVTAYELGVKAGLFDGMVQFNAAGFYMDYRDKQIKGKLFDFVFGTLDTLVNVPKSEIWGFEADVTVRPVTGLTLTGALTYLDSEIKEYFGYDIFGGVDNNIDPRPGVFDPNGNNQEDLSGSRIPYTPKWSGVFNADYRYEMDNGAVPFVGVTVNYRSKQSAAIGGEDTTLPVGLAFDGTPNRWRIADGVGPYPYTIDGYATVDARVGFEAPSGQWRIMAWGKNVFDKYYWTAVIPSSDSSARLAGKPATYGVTFGFKFN